jgi:hypothetical protein
MAIVSIPLDQLSGRGVASENAGLSGTITKINSVEMEAAIRPEKAIRS